MCIFNRREEFKYFHHDVFLIGNFCLAVTLPRMLAIWKRRDASGIDPDNEIYSCILESKYAGVCYISAWPKLLCNS